MVCLKERMATRQRDAGAWQNRIWSAEWRGAAVRILHQFLLQDKCLYTRPPYGTLHLIASLYEACFTNSRVTAAFRKGLGKGGGIGETCLCPEQSLESALICHKEVCTCRNLMAQQDLRDLGFRTEQIEANASNNSKETRTADSTSRQPGSDASERKRSGFIAGVRR